MSTTVTEQKKKGRKTSAQILEEIRNVMSKTKAVYIKDLCEAYREENPGWSNRDIQNRVESDCLEFGWNSVTVYSYLPSWIHDQKAVKVSKKGWETRNARKLEQARKSLGPLSGNDIQEPIMVKRQDEDENIEDEELTDTGPLLESHGEPEDNKNVMDFIKDINVAQHNLWKALTRNDTMPHVHEDLALDHIKPTRKFRKDLVDKTPGMDRAGISRRCGYLVAVLEDMIEIIEEAEK